MLIVNADDWGRSAPETDAALKCFLQGSVTSVTAMMFMADSERAATVAAENKIDVGLHLNFAEQFTTKSVTPELINAQARLVRFLMGNKYAQLLYNPFLGREFALSCEAQLQEFRRLYQKEPSHIDGHHHMHLCGNALFSRVLPRGSKLRRNFSFWPGEKSALNRAYRGFVDRWLRRRHRMTDYFFDLGQCVRDNKLTRVAELAKTGSVELMTHPVLASESDFLLGSEFQVLLRGLSTGGYLLL